MTELRIVAVLEVKADYKEELIKVIHTLVDESRKEEGCVSYDLHEDTKNPLKLIFLETWASQAAIDIHNNAPHFKAFVAAIKGKIDSLTIDFIKKIY